MSSRIPWRTRSRMRCSCSTVADSPGSSSSDNARAEPSEPSEPFSQGVASREKSLGKLLFFGSDGSVRSELPANRIFEWFSDIPALDSQLGRRDSPDHTLRPVLLSRWFRNPRSARRPPNLFCEPACSPVSSHHRFHAPHSSPAKASSSSPRRQQSARKAASTSISAR